MAGVAHQHRVVQLLVWDGQLQVTTVLTEHVTTVPGDTTAQKHEVIHHTDQFTSGLHQQPCT